MISRRRRLIGTVLLMNQNPYSAATSNVEPTTQHDADQTPMRFASFLVIAVVGIVLFPIALVCSVLAFWSSDEMSSLMLGVYVTMHATYLVVGLARRGLGRRLFGPIALATAVILGYNRHWLAQPDNSPFSDGIGTVDQRAYGVFAWFRKFDQPFSNFGDSYVDWTAFAVNIELVIALTVLLAFALTCSGTLRGPKAEP